MTWVTLRELGTEFRTQHLLFWCSAKLWTHFKELWTKFLLTIFDMSVQKNVKIRMLKSETNVKSKHILKRKVRIPCHPSPGRAVISSTAHQSGLGWSKEQTDQSQKDRYETAATAALHVHSGRPNVHNRDNNNRNLDTESFKFVFKPR